MCYYDYNLNFQLLISGLSFTCIYMYTDVYTYTCKYMYNTCIIITITITTISIFNWLLSSTGYFHVEVTK